MASLESTEHLRQVLIDYLKGESLGLVEDDIRKYIKGEKNGYQLYNKIYAYRRSEKEPEEAHPLTVEFLRLLEIDDSEEFNLLVGLTLYQMLNRLKGRYGHLDKLIDIIDHVHEPKRWTKTIILSILACTGIGLFLYFYPHLFWLFIEWFTRAFPQFVNWLCVIFTEVRSVAIIGIAWQSSVLLYTWYKTFKNGPNPSPDSLRTLAFKTLGIAMNIAGNVLMYLAHGALGPIAAVLFIACSLMDVIETIYLLFIKYENPEIDISATVRNANLIFKSQRRLNLDTPLTTEQLARNIRLDNMRERDLNILWIKLAATALITVSIILWCTMPSGIVLSLCFLVFGLLVNLAKDLIIKRITNQYAESLQTSLRVIYKNDSKALKAAKYEFANAFMEQTRNLEPDVIEILRKRWDELAEETPFNLNQAKKRFENAKNDAQEGYNLGFRKHSLFKATEISNETDAHHPAQHTQISEAIKL